MNRRLRDVLAIVAVTLAVIWCIPGVGQVLKGSISGTVTDPQGAVVSGAQVKATNVETGQVYNTTSDSSGLFRINLIPTGIYSVSITAQGFKTAEIKGKVVGAGEDAGLGSIHMAVGEASTTLEVVGTAPLIDTTQAQVTNTFSGVTLQTFAGVEENEGLDRLALFVPGVAASRSNNFSNQNGNGTGFSSNGLRGRNNDQEIDGQNNNDNSVGGPGLFVADPEFVQQYVLVTNQFGPEYGRNSGSVVNIITKQGTNAWHGSLYGTETNSFLNAMTNTQHNSPKPGSVPPTGQTGPPRSNEEFTGGTIGGPLFKNKAFIFGGFDNDLFSGSNVFTTTTLTPTPLGLTQLGACGLNAKNVLILQNFGPYGFSFGNPQPRPLGTGGVFTTRPIGICDGAVGHPAQVQVGGVTRILSVPFHGFNWVVRHDLQLGSDSITGRYIYNRGTTFNRTDSGAGAAAAGWFDNVPALSQAALASWTHNFSAHMVNEARVSFGRLNVEFGGGVNPLLPAAGGLDQAFTNIAISGALGIGPATNIPQSRLVNTWQGQDNWNYVLGKHQLKAGINFTYQRSPNIFLPIINGAYSYSSLNSFLGGNGSPGCPGGPTSSTPCGAPTRIQIAQGKKDLDFREYDTFLYVGDDWKMGQNFTLNLGLTWTYYGSPENLFHDITSTRESNPSTALWLQSLPLANRTNPEVPGIFNSFGPSVGFAYSPQWGGFLTGHGKTTLRGGYRRLYDPPFYNIFVNISSSAPMTFLETLPTSALNNNLLPATPTGPNVRTSLGSFIQTNTFDPRTQNETNVSPDFGPDIVDTWSFGFEREITKNAVFEARYVGNHGSNLFQTVDSNPFLGTATHPGLLQLFPGAVPNASSLTPCAATQQVGPNAGTDVGRVNCGVGVSRSRTNGAFSDYNGLQLEFRTTNLFKQLTMRTGYTWSKNLDTVSEIFATGTAGNTLFAAQNPFQTGDTERSISGINYPHVWTIAFTEQLPFFKEQHGAIGHLLGGWVLSADYILGSGQPYTPIQNGEAFRTNWNTTCTGVTLAAAPTPSCFADFYDTAFVNSFVGDSARPFYGSLSAPANTVGIFAGDACVGFAQVFGLAVGCSLPATTLISVNALNGNGTLLSTPTNLVPVTKDQVRFIINGTMADRIFGTPFGNVPRNPLRDAISNIANVSVFKNIKLTERVNFQIHATALNALNHFNFISIDPNMEDASVGAFNNDFANPRITAANGRTFYVGGKITF